MSLPGQTFEPYTVVGISYIQTASALFVNWSDHIRYVPVTVIL